MWRWPFDPALEQENYQVRSRMKAARNRVLEALARA